MMKVAVLVLALASQCLAAPAPLGDEYSDLIQDVLAYARQQLVAHEPFTFPDVTDEPINTDQVKLVLSQKNTQVSKASTFTVKEVSTDPSTLSARVQLVIPELDQRADYVVEGEVFGKKVSGQGQIKVILSEFAQKVDATFINPDTSLQLSSLGLEYDLDDVKISISGLSIEGMTEQQVQDFVQNNVRAYIMNSKDEVSKQTAKALQAQINNMIAGKTLQEVAAWVKSLIQH